MKNNVRNTIAEGRRSNHAAIAYWPISDLTPPQHRARTHSQKQIEKIKASIQRFGFIGYLLIKSDGEIIAGSARREAAQQLNFLELPVLVIDHLSAAEHKAYRIADNRLAELAGWDSEALSLEYGQILEIEADFELEITGFETAEIDLVLDPQDNSSPADAADDNVPELFQDPVSRSGDLWHVGKHRLYCGDAKLEASYDALLQGEFAKMVITDPPWNVPIKGHVGNSGKTQHREFVEASGEMSDDQFDDFLHVTGEQLTRSCANGALVFIFIDWRSVKRLIQTYENLGLELLNIIVWNKSNGGMGSLYRSKHEMVCLFKIGTAPHTNNIQLGATGRYRTNVWDYAGANSFGKGRMAQLGAHPTAKPVIMIADAIKDVTKRGDIVLDAFCGSGTTLIAAQKTERIARCLELDPLYVDTALIRFEERFGIEAIHAGTGLTFSAMREERRVSAPATVAAAIPSQPLQFPIRQRTRLKTTVVARPSTQKGAA